MESVKNGIYIEADEIITKTRNVVDKDLIKQTEELRKKDGYVKPFYKVCFCLNNDFFFCKSYFQLRPDKSFQKLTSKYNLKNLPKNNKVLDSKRYTRAFIKEIKESGIFDYNVQDIPSSSTTPTIREFMIKHLENINKQTCEMTELEAKKLFLKCISKENFGKESFYDYVCNIPVSIFDIIQEANEKFPASYNVNKMPSLLRAIYNEQNGDGGFTSSWTFCNQFGNRSVIHTEDFDAMSIHYIFKGGQPQVYKLFICIC